MSIAGPPLSSSASPHSAAFALGAHPRAWARLRLTLSVWWRAAELDRRLAAGASPWSSDELAERARRLTGRRSRSGLAGGLTRAAHDAEHLTGLTAAVRPHAREMHQARTVLHAVERRLRAPEPVAARGVAMVRALLTDGTSPLYHADEPGALASRLRAAAAALEPPPARPPR